MWVPLSTKERGNSRLIVNGMLLKPYIAIRYDTKRNYRFELSSQFRILASYAELRRINCLLYKRGWTQLFGQFTRKRLWVERGHTERFLQIYNYYVEKVEREEMPLNGWHQPRVETAKTMDYGEEWTIFLSRHSMLETMVNLVIQDFAHAPTLRRRKLLGRN